MPPVGGPSALLCAECGEAVPGNGVPLAALYLDADGHEVDADLAFCTPDHLDEWVTRVRPLAVAPAPAEARWRAAPRGRAVSYLGCFAAVATALVVLVLAAYLIGRLLG